MSEHMSQIQVKCVDQVLKIVKAPVIASGGLNEVCVVFDFCEKWDGFMKTALFYRDAETVYYAVLDDNDTCVVPWEVYHEAGYFYFSVFGEKGSARRTSNKVRYKIVGGAITEELIPPDPTPGVYDQIVALVNEMKEGQVAFLEEGENVLIAADSATADAANAAEDAIRATTNANNAAALANSAKTAAEKATEDANAATAEAVAATEAAQQATAAAETATEETIAARDAFLETASESIQTITELLGTADEGPAIVCEESGSNITLNDSANRLLKGLNLYGKTTRLSTTGKNLFGGDALADKLVDVASATKDEAAGTVKYYSGSVTGKLIFSVPDPTKQYTIILYGKNTSTSLPRTNLQWVYSDGTVTAMNFKTAGSLSYCVVTSASGKQLTGLYGIQSTDYTILHYDKCGIFEGVVAEADFEPYTNGKPSPSVDYPQDLVTVGTGGSIGVTAHGKNLFGGDALADTLVAKAKATKDEAAGAVQFAASNASNKVLFTGEFKENTRYTFVLYGCNTSESLSANLGISYTNDTYDHLSFPVKGENSCLVFTSAPNKTIRNFYGRYSSGYTILYYDKCGIFEGVLTEADFEPYVGSSVTASTPNGLPGIPVTSGGNYTDENGQRWVCDEIDFARGVRITRLAELVFDGVSNGKRMYSTDPSQLEASKTSIYAYMNYSYINPPALSSTTVYANYSGVSLSTAISITRTKTWLGLPQGEALTTTQVVTAYNTKLKELYDAGKPVRVLYQRKTPVETPLSAEELAAYAAMHTNKPNTTVYNDAGAGMKLQYVADTKSYIDNKFAELANAIVNNA